MNDTKKELTNGDKHLMRLIRRDADAEGWSKVSKMLLPIILGLPLELVESQATDDGGRARLTAAGTAVVEWT